MSSLKLIHSGGNSVSIAAPSSNPAANRTINLNDNYAGVGSFVTANSSGKVGIGLTNPVNNLDVSGSVSATGNMLNTAYADGVYIGTNGGLPAITAGKASNSAYAPLVFRQDHQAAGAERMRIDSSGRLLLGTTTEGHSTADDLTVATSGHTGITLRSGSSNNGNIYFSDGTSGNAELAGYIQYSHTSNHLLFGTNESTRMLIDSSGNKIMDSTFDVNSTSSRRSYFTSTGQQVHSRNAHESYIVFTKLDQTTVGSISRGTTTTLYNTTSDYRLKENVTGISDGITRLKTLKPSRFNFKADAKTTVDGFLAHEVSSIVPEAIEGEKDALITQAMLDSGALQGKVGDPLYQQIDQSKLVPLLTAALQEAIAKIETLETKVAALEAA